MKNYLLGAAAAVLLTTGAAQAEGTYFSVLGGASFDPALMAGGSLHDMDTGYNFGARVGTGLDPWLGISGFSVEADTFYNQSGYKDLHTSIGSTSLMGDLIYHFDTGLPVSLYGGAGVGGVNTHIGGQFHGSETVLGWQALGGVEYPVSDDMNLFAEYRYQNAHGVNIGALHDVGNTSNNLSIGMKFHL
jgi:opacity protein-like surface antigen